MLMVKMPFLQNHSDITFKIRRTLGLFSHFVETNSWGVCNHFVAGTNFILQNVSRDNGVYPYPGYLLCSLGILGDYNPQIPSNKGLYPIRVRW